MPLRISSRSLEHDIENELAQKGSGIWLVGLQPSHIFAQAVRHVIPGGVIGELVVKKIERNDGMWWAAHRYAAGFCRLPRNGLLEFEIVSGSPQFVARIPYNTIAHLEQLNHGRVYAECDPAETLRIEGNGVWLVELRLGYSFEHSLRNGRLQLCVSDLEEAGRTHVAGFYYNSYQLENKALRLEIVPYLPGLSVKIPYSTIERVEKLRELPF